MPGHVLIVDAVPTNRIVFKVKLSAAHYDTAQAGSAEEALRRAAQEPPTAIMLGEVDGIAAPDLVTRFRRHPKTAHVPLLVVLPGQDLQTRLQVLQAGADDVISKPIEDVVLLARLRSLQRAREAEAELRLRESTQAALGLAEAPQGFVQQGKIAFVMPNTSRQCELIGDVERKTAHQTLRVSTDDILGQVFAKDTSRVPDVFVVTLPAGADPTLGMQLLPELRTRPETRHAAILVLAAQSLQRTAATLLDLGANDLVRKDDLSTQEFLWRLDKLVERKQKTDRLRNTMRDGLRAAVTDPLTGLYNRRYALPHLARIDERARKTGRNFAVMVADLDHFKAINDRYGHPAGDRILREVARRLRDRLRAVDLLARLGGEEFLIVMPDTDERSACSAARRLCRLISDRPFDIGEGTAPVQCTISIGIAMGLNAKGEATADSCADVLMRDADRALYDAKAHGRNTIELFGHAA